MRWQLALIIVGSVIASQTEAQDLSNTEIARLEFAGHYREPAKTSFPANAQELNFPSLDALIHYLNANAPDAIMRNKYPGIENKVSPSHPDRVAEEMFKVTVPAYIHAVSLEDDPATGDHDFHIMLGTSPTFKQGTFFTAEASGLPRDHKDEQEFITVRQKLLSLIPAGTDFHHHFAPFNQPAKVCVTGYLYFDADHSPHEVGPNYAKPSSVWEIHPIRALAAGDC